MASFTLISMEVGCALWLFSSLPSKQDLSAAVQSTLQSSLEIMAETPYFQELEPLLSLSHLVQISLLVRLRLGNEGNGSLAASFWFWMCELPGRKQHSHYCCKQDPLMDAQSAGEGLRTNRIFVWSRSIFLLGGKCRQLYLNNKKIIFKKVYFSRHLLITNEK